MNLTTVLILGCFQILYDRFFRVQNFDHTVEFDLDLKTITDCDLGHSSRRKLLKIT